GFSCHGASRLRMGIKMGMVCANSLQSSLFSLAKLARGRYNTYNWLRGQFVPFLNVPSLPPYLALVLACCPDVDSDFARRLTDLFTFRELMAWLGSLGPMNIKLVKRARPRLCVEQ